MFNRHMGIARQLLNGVNNDPDSPEKVITGGKTWIYGYNVETEAQSSLWKRLEQPGGFCLVLFSIAMT